MIKKIFFILLFSSNIAHATPHESDAIDHFLAERGIFMPNAEVNDAGDTKASELIINAMAFLGVPYKSGGNTFESGFDCSGFVRAIYHQTAGFLLPRRAEQQAAATKTIDKTELRPGDLVFFNTMRRTFSHVGIYIGEGKFIHSPKPGAKVRVEHMGIHYWSRRFDGARRVPFSQPSYYSEAQ
jgi:cell wall-associated NlpC family hydrolase